MKIRTLGLALLLLQPLLVSAQNLVEYKARCTAGYTGPLDPGEKREVTDVPSKTCYEWIDPDLTPKFRKLFPPTEYALGNVTGWDESVLTVTFYAMPLNDPKRMSATMTTVIRKKGKWKDMREVALESRVALKHSVQELMSACEASARCEIFKLQSTYFTQTIAGEQ